MDGVENKELDTWLENLIVAEIAEESQITRIRRSRFPHIGSYDCDSVTVELRGGEEIRLFLKDYARSRLSKDQPERRRVRELQVYKELLNDAGLGTPGFYGAMWDESEGRFRILLELVEAEVVQEIDQRNGILAVAWLARMQHHFLGRAEQLARCDFLNDHSATYFQSKAANARRDVAELASVNTPSLHRVLECYTHNIDLMTAKPASLVHGGYIPWHIFIDRVQEPARVCVVDWELSARGNTLYDLAIFIDDAAPHLHDKLYQAYRDAAVQHGVPLLDDAAMRRVVQCFRLHRVIDWLSRSVEKKFPAEKIGWLVARAETFAADIETDS